MDETALVGLLLITFTLTHFSSTLAHYFLFWNVVHYFSLLFALKLLLVRRQLLFKLILDLAACTAWVVLSVKCVFIELPMTFPSLEISDLLSSVELSFLIIFQLVALKLILLPISKFPFVLKIIFRNKFGGWGPGLFGLLFSIILTLLPVLLCWLTRVLVLQVWFVVGLPIGHLLEPV